MKKDLTFFSNTGLTSTSANTLANRAKEYLQSIDSFLTNMQFYKETVGLLVAPANECSTLQEGITSEEFASIEALIDKEAKVKSFIAWLREAIKARESLVKELKSVDVETFCNLQGIEYPSYPSRGEVLTEDEYIGNLTVDERNKYFYLETQVAILGKAIHPNGYLSEARRKLKKVINKPHNLEGSGRDATMYNYIPVVSPEQADDLFQKLEKKHTDLQKRFNSMKYAMESAITESELKVSAEYTAASKAYNAKVDEVNAAFLEWQKKKMKEVQELKIVVPQAQEEQYKFFTNLGK